MNLKYKLIKIVTVAILTLILNACSDGGGKGKQNSDNRLYETPNKEPYASEKRMFQAKMLVSVGHILHVMNDMRERV